MPISEKHIEDEQKCVSEKNEFKSTAVYATFASGPILFLIL